MFEITLITMGKLKEKFYTAAAAEYSKRLGGYCRFELLELPESRLPENPSPAEIAAGLEKEAEAIFSRIPKGSWFCGRHQFSKISRIISIGMDYRCMLPRDC